MEELFFIDNATLNNPPKAQCPRDTSIKFLPMVPDSASGTVTLTAERLLGEMDFYNSDNEDPSEEIEIRMVARHRGAMTAYPRFPFRLLP